MLLALAIGIASGASLAAFAGARRTDTAVDRFVAFSKPADGGIFANPALYPAIERLPQVAASTLVARLVLKVVDRSERSGPLNSVAIQDLDFNLPIIVAGRMPNPERFDEVSINSTAAAHGQLRVGSSIRLHGFAPDQANAALRGTDAEPTGPRATVHVVGIIRLPADLSVAPATPDVSFTGNDSMYFTWAFFEKYRGRVALAGGTFLSFRARNAADLTALQAGVNRLSAGRAKVYSGSDDLSAATQARHATRVEALALLLFGALAGLVMLTLIAQAFARQVFLDTEDYPTLRAMGMTRAQLISIAAIRAAFIAMVGAMLAVVIAILASPRMPIGLARQAEVHRGISIDGTVLAIGAIAIVTLLTGYTALAVRRSALHANGSIREPVAARAHASRIAAALTGLGSPPSVTVGATLAFESGRGPSGIPARTALASAALAMTVVTGALTFGINLSRVADQPRLQGWNWDVAVGNPHSDDVSRTAIPLLSRDPSISAITAIRSGEGIPATIEGQDAGVFGVDVTKGPELVPYPEGRAPRAADEIGFGTKSMRDHHLHIGQRVRVSTGGPVRCCASPAACC